MNIGQNKTGTLCPCMCKVCINFYVYIISVAKTWSSSVCVCECVCVCACMRACMHVCVQYLFSWHCLEEHAVLASDAHSTGNHK